MPYNYCAKVFLWYFYSCFILILGSVAVGVIVKEENVNSHDSCISYYYETEFPTNEMEFLLTKRTTEFDKKQNLNSICSLGISNGSRKMN